MPNPIDQQIKENVLATLQGMTGYNVYSDGLLPDAIADKDIAISYGDQIPQPELAPAGHDQYLLPIVMTCYRIQGEEDATEPTAMLGTSAADIRVALGADIHQGNLVVNTIFETKDEFDIQSKPSTVIVTAHLQYRTKWNNPYQQ